MTKEYSPIEIAFWDAVPDETTLDDMANGIVINFQFDDKHYSLNTAVVKNPRASSIDAYYLALSIRINKLQEVGN